MMVIETNRYAEQLLAQSEVKEKSRLKRWVATTVTEISKFIRLLFAMGLIKKSYLAEYWSTNPVMATPFFNKTMPRDRFGLVERDKNKRFSAQREKAAAVNVLSHNFQYVAGLVVLLPCVH